MRNFAPIDVRTALRMIFLMISLALGLAVHHAPAAEPLATQSFSSYHHQHASAPHSCEESTCSQSAHGVPGCCGMGTCAGVVPPTLLPPAKEPMLSRSPAWVPLSVSFGLGLGIERPPKTS